MADRALWRVLLRRPRREGRTSVPGAQERRAELVVGVVSGLLALGALVAGSVWGNVRPSPSATDPVELQAVAWSSALVFAVSGIVATRRLAAAVGHVVAVRTIRAAGVAVRLLSTITGYVVVFFAALGLLSVSVTHILTAGALTGVVLGIAAQQSLGNVFAGLVLLFARPFTVGDHIRVRSGSLGGLFDGVVLGMSLTYVTLSTEDGLLKIPNSVLLAAAVGPFRQRPSEGGLASASTVPPTGAIPVIGSTAAAPAPGSPGPAPVAAPTPEPGSGPVTAPGSAPAPDPWRQLAEREDEEEQGTT